MLTESVHITMQTAVYGSAFLLCIFQMILTFRNLKEYLPRLYAVITALVSLYIMSAMLESASVTISRIIFWDNIKYCAMSFIPGAMLIFGIHHTIGKKTPKYIVILMYSIALINCAVIFTDGSHHLFRKSIQLIEVADSGYLLDPAYGVWFYSVYLLSIILPLLYCIYLYVYAFTLSGSYGRVQYGLHMFSVIILLFAGTVTLSSVFLYDIYVYALLLYLFIQYLLVFKYTFLNVVPMAKQFAFNRIGTAVMIFGPSGMMIDKNIAAEKLPASIPIANMYELYGFFNDVQYLSPVADKSITKIINHNSEDRYYTVVFHRISDDPALSKSYIANIVDVTEHHRLAAIEREQERIIMKKNFISDIHDGISGSITVINMLAGQDYETQDELKTALDNITQVSADAGRDIRLMLGAYDTEQATLSKLSGDIRYLGNTYTAGTSIHFTHQSNIDGHKDDVIDYFCFINLLLFFKECVINTVKHSGADNAESSISCSDQTVVLDYSDNGKGLSGSESGGYGLKSLDSRIRKIGGNLEITSSNGMKIKAVVPLNHK